MLIKPRAAADVHRNSCNLKTAFGDVFSNYSLFFPYMYDLTLGVEFDLFSIGVAVAEVGCVPRS